MLLLGPGVRRQVVFVCTLVWMGLYLRKGLMDVGLGLELFSVQNVFLFARAGPPR